MGTWSTEIKGDDTFEDVVSAFHEHLKTSQSVSDTSAFVLSDLADCFEDYDESESAYFALADCQWTYGSVEQGLLDRVCSPDFGTRNWTDTDKKTLNERREKVAQFQKRIATPNPKPKRFPKLTKRSPKFKPGDCIAIEHPDGRYTAGFVTATDSKDPEHGRDLVTLIKYLASKPPVQSDFERREWLHNQKGTMLCSWYSARSFRSVSKNIHLICTIPMLDSDPVKSDSHADWQLFGPLAVRVIEGG